MRPVLLALLMLSTLAAAQAPVVLSAESRGYAGPQAARTIVRDSAGVLYTCTIDGTVVGSYPIVVFSSTDNGLSWGPFIFGGINDATSGLSGSNPTNSVNMAIDDQDRLHFHWASHYYPSYFTNYYRSYDIPSGVFSTIVDVKAITGVGVTTRTTASQIAIGPDNSVWLTASTTTAWREQLLRSNVPYATTGAFTTVGPISATASSQNTRMAIDAFGNVHCVYYENTGTGDYRHRMYDPVAATWSVGTNLGDLIAVNDAHGAIVCDGLGNTHMICAQDSGGAAGTNDPRLVYYMRDLFGVFSAPVTLMNATAAQYTGNNVYFFSMTANEQNGDCHVFYRDFTAGGQLAVAKKSLTDATFSTLAVVRPPNATALQYYAPAVGGALFPASNNFNGTVHMTWRELTVAPFLYRYARLNTTGPRVVFADSVIAPGATVGVSFTAPGHAGDLYIPAISCTPGPSPIPASTLLFPLIADACFSYYFNDPFALFYFVLGTPGSFFGTLDANGEATGSITIPGTVPPGLGIPLHAAFVTAPGGLSVTDVSESATIVVQ